MKLTKTSKSLLLISAAVLVFFVWQAGQSTSCSTPATTDCVDTQRGWISWLAGDSRSAQFHFVDFLELVSRMFPATANKP